MEKKFQTLAKSFQRDYELKKIYKICYRTTMQTQRVFDREIN